MSAGMDASVAPVFFRPATLLPAGRPRRGRQDSLACCLRPLCLLLCLLLCCPWGAAAGGSAPPASPAPSLELEQLDLSGLPGLPPLPAEDDILPAAASRPCRSRKRPRQRTPVPGPMRPCRKPPLECPGSGA